MDAIADYIFPLPQDTKNKIPRKTTTLVKFNANHTTNPSHFMNWLQDFIEQNELHYVQIKLMNGIHYVKAHVVKHETYAPTPTFTDDLTYEEMLQSMEDSLTSVPIYSEWRYFIESRVPLDNSFQEYPFGDQIFLTSYVRPEIIQTNTAFIVENVINDKHIDWATILDKVYSCNYLKYRDTAHEYHGDAKEIIQIGTHHLRVPLLVDQLFCQSELEDPGDSVFRWDNDFKTQRSMILHKYLELI